MARYERFDDSVATSKLSTMKQTSAEHDNNNEKVDLFVSSSVTSCEQDESLTRHALITLNIISIVVSTVCGSITFFLAVEDQSVSALGFAIDTILDVLAFSIIIWRFTSTHEQVQREAFALRILAVLFFISGFAVFIDSILDLRNQTHPIHNQYLVMAVAVQTLIFMCLAIGKYLVAKRLNVTSAYSDAFNTLISALMAVSVAISITIYNSNDDIWYLDMIMGMFFSLTMMLGGIWMMIKSCQTSFY
jgi:divalent metal cation (Fe/Co/Zn/Cd) transporter